MRMTLLGGVAVLATLGVIVQAQFGDIPTCTDAGIDSEQACTAGCVGQGLTFNRYDELDNFGQLCFCTDASGNLMPICQPSLTPPTQPGGGDADDDADADCEASCADLAACGFLSECADALRCVVENHEELKCLADPTACADECDLMENPAAIGLVGCVQTCDANAPLCTSICTALELSCSQDPLCKETLVCSQDKIAKECLMAGNECSDDMIEQFVMECSVVVPPPVAEHVLQAIRCNGKCDMITSTVSSTNPPPVSTTTAAATASTTAAAATTTIFGPGSGPVGCATQCADASNCMLGNECGQNLQCAISGLVQETCEDPMSCIDGCVDNADTSPLTDALKCTAQCSVPDTCNAQCLLQQGMCAADADCLKVLQCAGEFIRNNDCTTPTCADKFDQLVMHCADTTGVDPSVLAQVQVMFSCFDACTPTMPTAPPSNTTDDDGPCGAQCIDDLNCSLGTDCAQSLVCMATGAIDQACNTIDECRGICTHNDQLAADVQAVQHCTDYCDFTARACPYACGMVTDVCFDDDNCRKALSCLDTGVAEAMNMNLTGDDLNNVIFTFIDRCSMGNEAVYNVIDTIGMCRMHDRCQIAPQSTMSTTTTTTPFDLCANHCIDELSCQLGTSCAKDVGCIVDNAAERKCDDFETCFDVCDTNQDEDMAVLNVASCFHGCGLGDAVGPYCVACRIESFLCEQNAECRDAVECFKMSGCSDLGCDGRGADILQTCTNNLGEDVVSAVMSSVTCSTDCMEPTPPPTGDVTRTPIATTATVSSSTTTTPVATKTTEGSDTTTTTPVATKTTEGSDTTTTTPVATKTTEGSDTTTTTPVATKTTEGSDTTTTTPVATKTTEGSDTTTTTPVATKTTEGSDTTTTTPVATKTTEGSDTTTATTVTKPDTKTTQQGDTTTTTTTTTKPGSKTTATDVQSTSSQAVSTRGQSTRPTGSSTTSTASGSASTASAMPATTTSTTAAPAVSTTTNEVVGCEARCSAAITRCSFDTTCIPQLECLMQTCNGHPSTACTRVCGLDTSDTTFGAVHTCYSDCLTPVSATVLLSSNLTFTGVSASTVNSARAAVLAAIEDFLSFHPFFIATHDAGAQVLFEYAVLVPLDVADDVRAAIVRMNLNTFDLLTAIRDNLSANNATSLVNDFTNSDVSGSDPQQTVSMEPSTSNSTAGVTLGGIIGIAIAGVVLLVIIVAVVMRSRSHSKLGVASAYSNPSVRDPASTFENPLYHSHAVETDPDYDTVNLQDGGFGHEDGMYFDAAPPMDEPTYDSHA
ncbi:hypothetical protein PTSG_05602 [Salpingoeca rosetta]|uniref:Uncharacterized protein n=1 Tax=Salpingoeca rosetta (strain ATCC 50818 / BSB-021) TaxID=946362 RepID=F2UBP0_SALR5|nr:uncharacterized protein PTSG_05602 [Salpingoeca rosetta]EGD73906.1 hypothetical protein PTSG_05602 [Salpingoeca rosetta]|eukprot:XP_004993469.1 hypothetical protein PTSG_05602 [Salpingoeca rosetta]